MALREFSWLNVAFGFLLAAILLVVGTVVLAAIIVAFPDRTVLTGKSDFIYMFPAMLLAGMMFFAWKCPGPGRIVETPPFTIGIILVWPAIAAMALLGGGQSWVAFFAFEGLFITTLVGFAVFFAIYTEAKAPPQAKTTWPIDRPASFGWMGSRGVPINKVMMYAGLERGGPEEERPDTFVRMKTKE